MRIVEINRLDEFQVWALEGHPNGGSLFRGHKDSSWKLIPGIGRHQERFTSAEQLLLAERYSIEIFEREAAAHFGIHRIGAWELLALAQHHGLPTRLLDWTHNPLVALFFAVCDTDDCDGAVFALDAGKVPDVMDTNFFTIDPLDAKGNHQYVPPRFDRRISAQDSVFVLCGDPLSEFSDSGLIKAVIPSRLKPDLRVRLDRFGVNRKNLFPGLEGIAQSIRFRKFGGGA